MAVQALHGLSSWRQVFEADQGICLAREDLDGLQGPKLAKDSLDGALVWPGGNVAQQEMPARLRGCSQISEIQIQLQCMEKAYMMHFGQCLSMDSS